jgi:acyl-CoA synthetase (AMP-forming)/AMP-acid ligase II
MISLAGQIAPQQTGEVVQDSFGRSVEAASLRNTGVAPDIGPDARVALKLRDPLDVVRALAALDGQVAAILLISHALATDTARLLAQAAGCTVFVSDMLPDDNCGAISRPLDAVLGPERRSDPLPTEWLMTTSGTTGVPKIVPHSLRSLARSVYRFGGGAGPAPVWGLLYDPTRFAGLQVVLQALIGGGRLVAIDTTLPLMDQVTALVDQGCTHLSATPTLWRRLMMVPGYGRLPLRQATLGGEIVDQPTLNAVRAAFPTARLSHIYASTEAGVGFSVTDGMAGFPLTYLDKAPGSVSLKVVDDVLWLRPPMTVLRPGLSGADMDAAGYVRSGDRVQPEAGRVVFLGRENGLINIGGVKVYPETVEAVIRAVPGVALVLVSAKRSAVTGALVVAEVQLDAGADADVTRQLVQGACRARLEREAVPAIIRFVEGFTTNAAGKLVRTRG